MAWLSNLFAKGTKAIPIPADPKRSHIHIPANEDWAMVVEVTAVSSGIIQGKKIWDSNASPKIFYARLRYWGHTTVPPDASVIVGQHVIFHRVGDFNSVGSGSTPDYEKHSQNAAGVSFVCFVPKSDLRVDNLNTPKTSTKVYDVASGGELSSNIGSLEQIFEVRSNNLQIKLNDTKFIDTANVTHCGPLAFETAAWPM